MALPPERTKGLFQMTDWLNQLDQIIPKPIADLGRVFAGVGSPEFSFTPQSVDTSGIPAYAMARGIPSSVNQTQISVPPSTPNDVLMAGFAPPALMGAGVTPAKAAAPAAKAAAPDLLEGVKGLFKDFKPPAWLEGHPNLRSFREANPDRFVLHGTPTAYGVGDPSKVSKGGLVGPGHYTSNSGDVVSTYAFGSTGDGDLNDYVRKMASAENNVRKYDDMIAEERALQQRSPEYGDSQGQELLANFQKERDAWQGDYDTAMKDLGDKADYYGMAPNIRPAILPPVDYAPRVGDSNFHLFDFMKEASPEDLAALDKVIEEMRGQPSLYPMAEWGVGGNNGVLHEELTNILNGQNRANEALAKAGYDAIRHPGGRMFGAFDLSGKPIEHDVTVVFPESLMKIRNALSGTPGGQANAGYAAGLGGLGGLALALQQMFGGSQQGQGAW